MRVGRCARCHQETQVLPNDYCRPCYRAMKVAQYHRRRPSASYAGGEPCARCGRPMDPLHRDCYCATCRAVITGAERGRLTMPRNLEACRLAIWQALLAGDTLVAQALASEARRLKEEAMETEVAA